MQCWNSVFSWPDYPLMLDQWVKSLHYSRGCTQCAGPGPDQSCEISGCCCYSNLGVGVRCPSAKTWVSQASLGSFYYRLCCIVCVSNSGKVRELKTCKHSACLDTSFFRGCCSGPWSSWGSCPWCWTCDVFSGSHHLTPFRKQWDDKYSIVVFTKLNMGTSIWND